VFILSHANSGSSLYERFYFRGEVNTTWFPLSQLCIYFLLSIVGWSMINTVNCERKNPFTSGNSNYRSFKQLLIAVPIVFSYSVINIQRQRYDLTGYCAPQAPDETPAFVHYLKQADPMSVSAFYDETVDDELVLLLHSFTQMNYLGEVDAVSRNYECETYSDVQIFNYNFFIWCTSFFFVGLQFTHFDEGFMTNFTLDPQTMATWGPGMWMAFFILFGLIGLILADVCYHYYLIGILKYYGIWAVVLFSALVW